MKKTLAGHIQVPLAMILPAGCTAPVDAAIDLVVRGPGWTGLKESG